jgi:hypothetical protein
MNPFPNMPNVTDLGDGRRMVETHDTGHCYRIVEADGKVSVTICASPSPPKPAASGEYHVRHADHRHEIIDPNGGLYATTTDPAKADHICNLLIVYERMMARKASSGA